VGCQPNLCSVTQGAVGSSLVAPGSCACWGATAYISMHLCCPFIFLGLTIVTCMADIRIHAIDEEIKAKAK